LRWFSDAVKKTFLYIPRFRSNFSRAMMDSELSYWGIWCVPLGLVICFGPALFVWLKEEFKTPPDKK